MPFKTELIMIEASLPQSHLHTAITLRYSRFVFLLILLSTESPIICNMAYFFPTYFEYPIINCSSVFFIIFLSSLPCSLGTGFPVKSSLTVFPVSTIINRPFPAGVGTNRTPLSNRVHKILSWRITPPREPPSTLVGKCPSCCLCVSFRRHRHRPVRDY